MIAPDTVAAIHEAARIEEVVGDFVSLRKRGANLLGLCPFHNERTPSFTVSPVKNLFKCFGCGKGGSPVQFVMEYERLDYPAALRYLAQRYNIPIEEKEEDEALRQRRNLLESLALVNHFAQQYFSDLLLQNPEGQSVGGSYFKERGFLQSTLEKFQLGYSLDSFDGLLQAATQKGYQSDYLLQLGLLTEKNGKRFDFFRARVIFPIHNAAGRVVAFAGRTLLNNDKTQPKYINSPETELYIKSKTLYGLHLAKKAIQQHDFCFLVEGYTDVISLHQAGIENVVASSGTSLTEGQIQLIKRYTTHITVLYDGDAAGIKAALRGLDMILEADMNVKIVNLPPTEDPDSWVRQKGAAGFLEYVQQNAKDFIFYKATLLAAEAAHDPVKRSELVHSIVDSIARIPDAIKRSVYVRECATLLQVPESLLIAESNKIRRQQFKAQVSEQDKAAVDYLMPATAPPPKQNNNTATTDAVGLDHLEREVLRLLLRHGSKEIEPEIFVIPFVLHDLQDSKITFKNALCAQVLLLFEQALHEDRLEEARFFQYHENSDIAALAADLLSEKYQLSHNWEKMHQIYVKSEDERFKEELLNLLNRYKVRYLLQWRDELAQALKQAQEQKDATEMMRLLILQNECLKLQKSLSQYLKSDTLR